MTLFTKRSPYNNVSSFSAPSEDPFIIQSALYGKFAFVHTAVIILVACKTGFWLPPKTLVPEGGKGGPLENPVVTFYIFTKKN